MTNIYDKKKRTALNSLLKLVGKKSILATALGYSNQTIQMWFLRGQISKDGALKVEQHPELSKYITKEELRPDVDWKNAQ